MARRLTQWDLKRIARDSSIGFFYNNTQSSFALGCKFGNKMSDLEKLERVHAVFNHIKQSYIGFYSSRQFDLLRDDICRFLGIQELEIGDENTFGRLEPTQVLSKETITTLRSANMLDVRLMELCGLQSEISYAASETPENDDVYKLILNEQLRDAAFRLSERCKKLEKIGGNGEQHRSTKGTKD